MIYSNLAAVVAFSASALAAAPSKILLMRDSSSDTQLSENAIQTGSFSSGVGAIGSEDGQAASLTSTNNFINYCEGKTLTNGLQFTEGSCNGIAMGDIPSKNQMVSSVITFPQTGGQSISADTDFNITVQMSNLVAGSFTDADTTYYAAPQQLSGGAVVGHTHVTVQNMGSDMNPTQPLDPTQFAFFKGINDAGNGFGFLTATVTGGLPAGFYRVCTMASASNHQPVLMPVAQRGTADDCTKFVVEGDGRTENVNANDGSGGIAAASKASAAIVGATNSAFAASEIAKESEAAAEAAGAAATTTSAFSSGNTGGFSNNDDNSNNGFNGGGFGHHGHHKQRFAKRNFIA